MPIVNVTFFPGRTVDQKRELVKRLTDVVVEVAGTEPHDVWVTFTEVPKNDFGVGGQLMSDVLH